MGRIAGVTPEETRERLLDAAARVFELKGYEGATVAQIAHEAGRDQRGHLRPLLEQGRAPRRRAPGPQRRATASLFSARTAGPTPPSVLVALGTRLGEPRTRTDAPCWSRRCSRPGVTPSWPQVLAAALGEREAARWPRSSPRARPAASSIADVSADGRRPLRPDARPRLDARPHASTCHRPTPPTGPPSSADSIDAFTEETNPMTALDRDVNSVDEIVIERDPALARRRRPRGRPAQRRAVHVGLRAQPHRAGEALREGQDVPVERHHRPARGRPRSTGTSSPTEAAGQNERFSVLRDHRGLAARRLGRQGVAALRRSRCRPPLLSQFLHGEQGALVCTGLITATVPWIDAKYYAATQVMDEARHVEVFGRYIEEKTNGAYPISPQLGALLDDIIADGRWDITYLGMQIMVEGLALAAFGFMHMLTTEPLLKQLLRYVMSDEARHVAFGVLSLKEFYEGLDAKEIRERQEFAFEAAVQPPQPVHGPGRVGAARRRPQGGRRLPQRAPAIRASRCSRRCCSRRSSPTPRSSACSTPATAGCAPSSPSSASSSSRTGPTPPRSTPSLDAVAADRA